MITTKIINYLPYMALFASIFIFFTLLFNTVILQSLSNKVTRRVKKLQIQNIEKSLESRFVNKSTATLHRQRIKAITGEKQRKNEQIKENIINTINNKYHTWGYFRYTITTLISTIIGYNVGLLINNPGASLILAFIFATLPYFYLQYKISTIEKDKNEKLLIVMGNIQSAYMKTDTFASAIKDILENIPYPLYPAFKLYVDDVYLFDVDSQVYALENLAKDVDNYFFYEYIQMAIQAETGEKGLKYTMASIPKEYQSYLSKNKDFANIVEDYNINFILRIIAFPLMVGFLRVVSKDYYNVLVNTGIGKLLMILIIIMYIVASVLYKKYNKEVNLEL